MLLWPPAIPVRCEFITKESEGSTEMAPQLKAFAALTEDLSSLPSTHEGWFAINP